MWIRRRTEMEGKKANTVLSRYAFASLRDRLQHNQLFRNASRLENLEII